MNIYHHIPPQQPPNGYVGIDIEIFGMNDKTLHRPTSGRFACLSIATSPEDVYMIHDINEIPMAMYAIKDSIWIAHNSKFDLMNLRRWDKIEPRKKLWDTLLIERILYGGYFDTFSLADLARRYLNIYMEKETRDEFKTATEMSEQMIQYAALDASITLSICYAQQKVMTKNDFKIWSEVDCPALWAVMDMRGMAIDVDKWLALAELNKQRGEELKALLPINPRSYKKLKLYLIEHGFKGLKNTQEDTLIKAMRRYPKTDAAKYVQTILDSRDYLHSSSTYGRNFVERHVEYDDRVTVIVPDWNITGAETGRMSCVTKDTLIEMPRDLQKYPNGVPLELVQEGDYVYSFNWEKKISLQRVIRKWFAGYKQILQITARGEWGDIIKLKCTPDHLIRLYAGEWKVAGKLKVGNRLLCMLHRGYKEDGYAYFFPTSKRKSKGESSGRILEHRWVYAQMIGKDRLPTRFDVHHIDGNKQNNSISNLEFMYHPSHLAMHRKGLKKEEVIEILSGKRDNPVTKKHLQRLTRKYGLQGTNHTITNIEWLGEEEVWDLEIENTHCFIANSIAVHNCSDPNLQNIPVKATKEFRECFIARPGHIIIVWDYSSQEPRICAEITQDKRLLEILHSKNDIYCEMAWDVYEKRIQKSDLLRDATKPVFLGLNYGESPYGLAKTLGIEVDEAERLQNKFLKKYKGVAKLIEDAKHEKKYVKTILGRRAWLNPYSNQCERNAVNSRIQGSAGDMTKQALAMMHKEWNFDCPFSVTGVIHDEIVADVPKEYANDIAKFGQQCMVEVAQKMCPSVPAEAKIYMGSSWACKE